MYSILTLFNINNVVFCFLVCKTHLAKTKIKTLAFFFLLLLRGWRLKGKGKGVLGARETRGAREEGGKETPARRPLYFSFLNGLSRLCACVSCDSS